MALDASVHFDAMMDGRMMRVGAALTITLPVVGALDFTKALKSVQINEQMNTDLPDGVRDEAGYATLGGTMVLSGSVRIAGVRIRVVDLFNPDNAASPIYHFNPKGSLVDFDFGGRPKDQPMELLDWFGGRISSIAIDYDGKAVTLNVVDLTSDWDTLDNMPTPVTAPPFNAGLTSEFLMDAAARSLSNGMVSSWPAQRPHCVLAVGMRSSVWPEVGTLNTGYPNPPTFAPGAFGSALTNPPGAVEPVLLLAAPVTGNVFAECWVTGISGATDGAPGTADLLLGVTSPERLAVIVLASGITVHVVDRLSGLFLDTWTVPISAAPHYVAASAARSGTTMSGTVYLDGATHTFAFSSMAAASGTLYFDAGPVATSPATIEAIQVTTESTPTPSYPFTPGAVLDPSLNPLQVPPAVPAGTKAWDYFQELADAECGYIRRGPDGVLRFTNRTSILTQAVTRTVSSKVSLKDLQTEVGAFTEYDHIQIDYTDWVFSPRTSVFTLAALWTVPRGTHRWTQTIDSGGLAAQASGTAAFLPAGHNPLDGGFWYRASLDAGGLHSADPADLTVTATQPTSGSISISIANTGPTCYMVAPAKDIAGVTFTDVDAGTAALWLGGIPVAAADPTILDVVYDPAGATFLVPANELRQDRDATLALGQFLLKDLHRARPDYTNISIVPDARIQIPDLIELDDPKVSGISQQVLVWGRTLTADFTKGSESWDMTLNGRALAPPGAWLLGTPGRSELGDGASITGTAWAY